MSVALWQQCLDYLQDELSSQQFNTWIRPLVAEWRETGLVLAAPNRFIRDFVAEKYLPLMTTYLMDVVPPASAQVSVTVSAAQQSTQHAALVAHITR